MTPLWLTFLVIAAMLFAVGGLTATIWTTLRFGQRRRFAPATGSEWQGVQYALIGGMMPWAKESARDHLGTYFAGVVYHLGIAAGFGVVIWIMLDAEISEGLKTVLVALTFAGALCGAGLLIKRATTLALRSISTPDDVISNVLVTAFLALGGVAVLSATVNSAFLVLTSILLLYVPLGKIRHCFLFFCSRITFGRFFGRRAVLPHRAIKMEKTHVD